MRARRAVAMATMAGAAALFAGSGAQALKPGTCVAVSPDETTWNYRLVAVTQSLPEVCINADDSVPDAAERAVEDAEAAIGWYR